MCDNCNIDGMEHPYCDICIRKEYEADKNITVREIIVQKLIKDNKSKHIKGKT